MADREEGLDIELVDWVDFIRAALYPPAWPAIEFNCRDFPSMLSVCGKATPADLTTLTTPAVKPSSKNTMRPNGVVDNQRSTPSQSPPRRQRRDQLRGKAETQRHCRCSGGRISAFGSGLISLIFRSVANSDNRWSRLPSLAKRFVGRRLIAILRLSFLPWPCPSHLTILADRSCACHLKSPHNHASPRTAK